MSEISLKGLQHGQVVMRTKRDIINFKTISTDNYKLLQQCPRNLILSDISSKEYEKYFMFKKRYTNTLNKNRLIYK